MANDGEYTPEQQNALLNNIRSEVQQQALAEMSQNITQKCFEKCVSRPGSQLDTKQQSCLAMCMDRYIDTMQAVSHRVMQRGQNQ